MGAAGCAVLKLQQLMCAAASGESCASRVAAAGARVTFVTSPLYSGPNADRPALAAELAVGCSRPAVLFATGAGTALGRSRTHGDAVLSSSPFFVCTLSDLATT